MKNNPEDIARVNSMLTDCVELKLQTWSASWAPTNSA